MIGGVFRVAAVRGFVIDCVRAAAVAAVDAVDALAASAAERPK